MGSQSTILHTPEIYPVNIKVISSLLILDFNTWNSDLLEELLSPTVATVVRSIYISSMEDKDVLEWTPSVSGKFSTKSCYKICANSMSNISASTEFP